jgi:hypothetical protein
MVSHSVEIQIDIFASVLFDNETELAKIKGDRPRISVTWLALLLHIQEVSGLKLSMEAGYPDGNWVFKCPNYRSAGSNLTSDGMTFMLSGSLVTTASRVLRFADEGEGLQIWRVAANILNKQSRTANKEWPSSLGVGRGANNSPP